MTQLCSDEHLLEHCGSRKKGDTTEVLYEDVVAQQDGRERWEHLPRGFLSGHLRGGWCFSQGRAWQRGFPSRMEDSGLAEAPNDSRSRCKEQPEGWQPLPTWDRQCDNGLQEQYFQEGTAGLGYSGLSKVPTTQNLRRYQSGLCKICWTPNASISLHLCPRCLVQPSLAPKCGEAVVLASDLEGPGEVSG